MHHAGQRLALPHGHHLHHPLHRIVLCSSSFSSFFSSRSVARWQHALGMPQPLSPSAASAASSCPASAQARNTSSPMPPSPHRCSRWQSLPQWTASSPPGGPAVERPNFQCAETMLGLLMPAKEPQYPKSMSWSLHSQPALRLPRTASPRHRTTPQGPSQAAQTSWANAWRTSQAQGTLWRRPKLQPETPACQRHTPRC